MIKLAKTVRKTICELNTRLLSILEKMRKSQLVSWFVLIVFYWICISDPTPSSPPFRKLPCIPIAYLHPLVIKTRTFRKSFNYKIYLSFRPFNTKIEPCWLAIRICLFLQLYFIDILTDLFHICKIPTLEIAPEYYRTDRNHPSSSCVEAFNCPVYFFQIYHRKVLIRKGLKQLQFDSLIMLLLSAFARKFWWRWRRL